MADPTPAAPAPKGLISQLHDKAAARHAAIDAEIAQKKADHKAEVAKLKAEQKQLGAVLKAAGKDVVSTATGTVNAAVQGVGTVTKDVADGAGKAAGS